ncbi:MAG: hypothetical protein ABI821_00270 [Pseudomonadota bacterium]
MNTATLTRNRFPIVAVAALGALIVVSFARTYYLRFMFGAPPLTQLVHVHGLIATVWLVLHYTQARLIAARRVDLHMRLGILTACVGVALIVQAVMLATVSAAHGHAPPGRNPLQFMSVSLGTTTMFALFLGCALALRRKREWHKRLMLLATLALIVPATGRLDTFFMQPLGLPRRILALWLTIAFVVWACVNDYRRTGRIHPAYLIGGAASIASLPLRQWIGTTDAWMPFAQWLVS